MTMVTEEQVDGYWHEGVGFSNSEEGESMGDGQLWTTGQGVGIGGDGLIDFPRSLSLSRTAGIGYVHASGVGYGFGDGAPSGYGVSDASYNSLVFVNANLLVLSWWAYHGPYEDRNKYLALVELSQD